MKFKEFFSSHGYSVEKTGGNCDCLIKAGEYGNFIITSKDFPSVPNTFYDQSILSFEPLRGEVTEVKEGSAIELIRLNPSLVLPKEEQLKVCLPFPEPDHNID